MKSILTTLEHSNNEFFKKVEGMPINLRINHVMELLGVCRATAYKLTQSDGFPAIRPKGVKRIIIPKNQFIEWYINEIDTNK